MDIGQLVKLWSWAAIIDCKILLSPAGATPRILQLPVLHQIRQCYDDSMANWRMGVCRIADASTLGRSRPNQPPQLGAANLRISRHANTQSVTTQLNGPPRLKQIERLPLVDRLSQIDLVFRLVCPRAETWDACSSREIRS